MAPQPAASLALAKGYSTTSLLRRVVLLILSKLFRFYFKLLEWFFIIAIGHIYSPTVRLNSFLKNSIASSFVIFALVGMAFFFNLRFFILKPGLARVMHT